MVVMVMAMVVVVAAMAAERRKDESKRGEGAQTFSLRGLRNLRARLSAV